MVEILPRLFDPVADHPCPGCGAGISRVWGLSANQSAVENVIMGQQHYSSGPDGSPAGAVLDGPKTSNKFALYVGITAAVILLTVAVIWYGGPAVSAFWG